MLTTKQTRYHAIKPAILLWNPSFVQTFCHLLLWIVDRKSYSFKFFYLSADWL